jgi:hypothetical protein
MPFRLMPSGDVLGAAAQAIHDRVQAPLAICSQSVLAAAALAVQAHADVELPMGHVRPVSDFFVTLAETGARKSASGTEATWPIRKHEQALGETRDAELPNYVNDKTVWKRGKGNRATTKLWDDGETRRVRTGDGAEGVV